MRPRVKVQRVVEANQVACPARRWTGDQTVEGLTDSCPGAVVESWATTQGAEKRSTNQPVCCGR